MSSCTWGCYGPRQGVAPASTCFQFDTIEQCVIKYPEIERSCIVDEWQSMGSNDCKCTVGPGLQCNVLTLLDVVCSEDCDLCLCDMRPCPHAQLKFWNSDTPEYLDPFCDYTFECTDTIYTCWITLTPEDMGFDRTKESDCILEFCEVGVAGYLYSEADIPCGILCDRWSYTPQPSDIGRTDLCPNGKALTAYTKICPTVEGTIPGHDGIECPEPCTCQFSEEVPFYTVGSNRCPMKESWSTVPEQTAHPSPTPSSTPSSSPSASPSDAPSASPKPSQSPSETPSISPAPSAQPSSQPSSTPSAAPSIYAYVDVHPGCLQMDGNGKIPVTIYGSPSVDVQDVILSSLSLNYLAVTIKKNGSYQCSIQDTNEDGYDDLVCQFEDDAARWQALEGEQIWVKGMVGDKKFIGYDVICVHG